MRGQYTMGKSAFQNIFQHVRCNVTQYGTPLSSLNHSPSLAHRSHGLCRSFLSAIPLSLAPKPHRFNVQVLDSISAHFTLSKHHNSIIIDKHCLHSSSLALSSLMFKCVLQIFHFSLYSYRLVKRTNQWPGHSITFSKAWVPHLSDHFTIIMMRKRGRRELLIWLFHQQSIERGSGCGRRRHGSKSKPAVFISPTIIIIIIKVHFPIIVIHQGDHI
jgi:hypothetical protein